jgi:hypothetical protein
LLGLSAFLDGLFNYGDIFRQINSVFFMLISLGLLIRTTTKVRARIFERQVERITELEAQVAELEDRVNEVAIKSPSPTAAVS